jgi:hypothetical protein
MNKFIFITIFIILNIKIEDEANEDDLYENEQ